jgi:exodeoxyribonuclease VII small subunit
MGVKFEEGLKRLEELVRKLESGELDLEESMNAYREGRELLQRLGAMLEGAERQVWQVDEEGVRPLDVFGELTEEAG